MTDENSHAFADLPPIQMLWISGPLSNLERLSISSFIACGHEVHLYTYGIDGEIPKGVTVRDANEIIHKSRLFRNPSAVGFGSVAPFADIFRYTLLLEQGGMWCDTDMVCLKPLTFAKNMEIFFSSEYVATGTSDSQQRSFKPNIGAIKASIGHPVIAECLRVATAVDLHTSAWAQTGPGTVADVLERYKHDNIVLHPDIFCSVPHWEFQTLFSGFRPIIPQAYAIHFWNEICRWNFIDKNGDFEPLSIFERLKKYFLGGTGQLKNGH